MQMEVPTLVPMKKINHLVTEFTPGRMESVTMDYGKMVSFMGKE